MLHLINSGTLLSEVKIVIILLLFLLGLSSTYTNEDELLGVVIIFRHGDRNPMLTYKNDPYKNIIIDGSRLQLTNVGKNRLYNYGKWLRNRYKNFLPEEYSPKEFHISSDNVDRTLESAASLLAGLYPPTSNNWNPDINWQPIPIHVQEEIINEFSVCPKLALEVLRSQGSFNKIIQANKRLFDYIGKHTGEKIVSFTQIESLYDVLNIEYLQNLTLPEWTKPVFPEPLRQLTSLFFLTFTLTEEMSLLTEGPFIHNLVEKFDLIKRNFTNIPKFYMYSGHDVNIFSLMKILNSNTVPFCPKFGSSIIFELRKKINDIVVNFYLKENDILTSKKLTNCSFDCSFKSFKELVKPYSMSTSKWKKACSVNKKD